MEMSVVGFDERVSKDESIGKLWWEIHTHDSEFTLAL